MKTSNQQIWFVLTMLAVQLVRFPAQADIQTHYFNKPIILLVSGAPDPYYYQTTEGFTYDLDINQDGTTEIRFLKYGYDGQGTHYEFGEGVKILHEDDGEYFPQSQIGHQEFIGPQAVYPATWYAGFQYPPSLGFPNSGSFGSTYPGEYLDCPTCSYGPWEGKRAFLGLRFPAADGEHFGWVDFSMAQGIATGFIHGMGYETIPGQGLYTPAAIPEPSATLLIVFGCALLFVRNGMRHRGLPQGTETREGFH